MLKQQVLDLEADRMSTHHLASNQLRLWLATIGYVLLERVGALGLSGSELAKVTMGSVRRMYVQLEQRLSAAGTLWAVPAAADEVALVE